MDLCIPLEILHEFILQSSSSPSSLAAWCSVSRSLLSFAAPLLCRTVVLKRSEDVIPFLKNLLLARLSSLPLSSSFLLPFLQGIERLEILALPPQDDACPLLLQDTTESPFSTKDLVLAINWEAQTNMSTFWIPTLVCLLQPHQYEELGTLESLSFSGLLLDVYIRSLRLDTSSEYLQGLYSLMASIIRQLLPSLHLDRMKTSEWSSLLESLHAQLEEQRPWFLETNLLRRAPDGVTSFEDVADYLDVHSNKFQDHCQTSQALALEHQRLGLLKIEDLRRRNESANDAIASALVTKASLQAQLASARAQVAALNSLNWS